MVPSITPQELSVELQSGNPPTVIDVREAEELEVSSLPGIVHIPLAELSGRLGSIDPEANLVILCRVGGRSAHATAYMLQKGFKNVRNLTDGINGWARTVDPSMAEY